MGDVIDRISLDRAWKEIEPAILEIERLVMTAPLSGDDRARLASFVAARTFGMTAAAMGLTPDHVEEIAAHIGGIARTMKLSN